MDQGMAVTQNMSSPSCVSSAGPWQRARRLTTQLSSFGPFSKVPAGEWFSSCSVVTCKVHRTLCVALDASGHSCVRSQPRAGCEVREWEAGRPGVSQGLMFQPSEEDNPPPNQKKPLSPTPFQK